MSEVSASRGILYGQLAGLLKAGMPLPGALRLLAREARSARFRAALERAGAAIEQGVRPEDAFRAEERELGGMLGRVAAATALSGRLPAMLAELSAWTLAQERIRRRIREALAYPLMVLFLTSFLCLGMMYATHASGYAYLNQTLAREIDLGGELDPVPSRLTTVMAFAASSFVFLVVAGVFVTRLLAYLSAGVRRRREKLAVWLPIAGAITRPLALARFCGGVSILMKAGVPYHDAVVAGGLLTGYAPYEEAARRVSAQLAEGMPQEQAWADSRLFPPSLRFVLASGAQRGDLPQAFAELAALYEVEAEGRGRLVALVAPPLCLIGIGVLVGLYLAWLLGPLSVFIGIMERLS